MSIGIIGIVLALLKKLIKGNLVVAEMVKSFSTYLNEQKDRQGGNTLLIDDEIEFYPQMIEPLYKFIL